MKKLRMRMRAGDLLSVLLLSITVVGVFSAKGVCLSGQYTTRGECCKQCQPGEGVVKPCNETQTVCEPCLDSETFSEFFSHTDACWPCTRCTGLLRMETPCTDTNDAVCVCDYGYFYSTLTSRCQACTMCPVGQGVLARCDADHDTVCEECLDDSFSDTESVLDPCLPCTVCDEQGEQEHCTSVKDTVCQVDMTFTSSTPFASMEPSFPPNIEELMPDAPTDEPPEVITENVSKVEGSEAVPTSGPEPKKLSPGLVFIPYYISIVPAVLLGIAAFFIIKRCKCCKNNKQRGANPSGTANPSQTPSPEGEKLHSDSGISVDSQSLQEGQGLAHTVIKIDSGSALSLSLHTREEVEKLLNHTCGEEAPGVTPETDWCSLAGLLGYEEERIASFRQEERPIQALLSDWASRDSASVDTLCTALRKINREDIAQSIMLKSTATSSV